MTCSGGPPLCRPIQIEVDPPPDPLCLPGTASLGVLLPPRPRPPPPCTGESEATTPRRFMYTRVGCGLISWPVFSPHPLPSPPGSTGSLSQMMSREKGPQGKVSSAQGGSTRAAVAAKGIPAAPRRVIPGMPPPAPSNAGGVGTSKKSSKSDPSPTESVHN